MAITSDAMYNARTTVPSFMSSNLYYDYVPQRRKENQLNAMFEHAEIKEPPVFNCYSDAAMETDEEGYDYSMTSRYFNNEPVVLDATIENRLNVNDKRQVQQPATYGADTLQRGNRKRCSSDLNPTNQLKKFRIGGGKDYVHYGTGNTKGHGSTTVPYKSEALHVNTVNNNLEQSMNLNKSCCWTADNCNLLNNTDGKQLLSNNGHTSIENNVEYEKILFETHGCSIYQFHRMQLVNNDCIEAEL